MRRILPAVTLFILSPLLAEIIFGATTFANIGGFLVVAPLYGGGALLIREVVRRRGLGWASIALLGAAYGVMEEGLALGSLFNPAAFNAGDYGGLLFGVNGVWTVWTVGYHIVWSITIPILLAELLFPAERAKPWLGRIGLVIVALLYIAGFVGLALIFRFAVYPDYSLPLPALIAAAAVVIGLIVTALRLRPVSISAQSEGVELRDPPSPWIVGMVALLASALWFELLFMPTWLRTGPVVLVPVLLLVAVEAGALALIRQWSAPGRRWTDLHRLALADGVVLTNMLVGYFRVTAGDPTNQLFQGIVSVICFVLLAIFTYLVYQRERVELVSVHQR